MTRYVIALTGAILAALSLLIIVGAARADYTMLGTMSGRSKLERCFDRCRANNPPMPSPEPTHSPKPLPCESIGGVKTFVEGEPRMFCFDVGQGGSFLVEVASTTPANVGCSYFRSQLTAPDGTKANTDGAYPMAAARRMPGRYYLWVEPVNVGAGLCGTYSFTVSK